MDAKVGNDVLKTLAREDVSCVACLEGPRNAIGYKKKESPEVEELRRMIPYQISFDGCAYVLLDANGDPLYKPWRFRPMRRSCSSP